MSNRKKYKEFLRQDVTKVERIRTAKLTPIGDLWLPMGATIHHIPESETMYGIDGNHGLLRNMGRYSYIYHVEEMQTDHGHVTSIRVNTKNMMRDYHKHNISIKKAKQLRTAMHIYDHLVVMDYSLLNHMYRYSKHNLLTYQQWANLRNTMWANIIESPTDRFNFIRYTVPLTLPTKSTLDQYSKNMTPAGLVKLGEQSQLDLLELWTLLDPKSVNVLSNVDDSVLNTIHLVFVESGQSLVVRLSSLLEWSKDSSTSAQTAIYGLYERLVSIRNKLNIAGSAEPDPGDDFVGGESIRTAISEMGLAGKLTGAEQRGLVVLARKYKKLKDPLGSDRTIEDILTDTKDLTINDAPILADAPNILDKSFLNSSIKSLDSDYISKRLNDDIVDMTMMLQAGGLIVTSIKATPTITAATKSITYSIQVQPINGKVSTVKFTIPIIEPDGSFMVAGSKYRLDRQRGELVIFKDKPDTVALTSYYGKQFIVRNNNAAVNYSKWIFKFINSRGMDSADTTIGSVVYGLNQHDSIKLPRQFTAVGNKITSFVTPQYQFIWNLELIATEFTDLEKQYASTHSLALCGRAGKVPLGMDNDGIIYEIAKDSSRALGVLSKLIDPSAAGGPIEYTELSVFNKRLPVILALAYHWGLDGALSHLDIPFNLVPAGQRVVADDTHYVLKLKDVTYVINISNPVHSLLVGGFRTIRTISKDFKSESLNRKQIYGRVFSKLGLTTSHLRELKLMLDMFVDPITLSILKEYKQPTDFTGLLILANSMLVDDSISTGQNIRIKGYERIPGMVYGELINSLRGFRARGNYGEPEFTMNPRAVWLNILQDQTKAIIEESGPIHNLKEKEVLTYAGAGGRSSESMVKSTRGFRPDELGLISESTPDSQKVGIRSYLSADPQIQDLHGIPSADVDLSNSASILSTTSLLAPAITGDDAKRVNFASIQNSHNVACPGHEVIPFRTGYEQVVAHRVDDIYAKSASGKGKVTGLTDSLVTVTYTDGRVENFKLGVQHGKVADKTIPHQIVTKYKVGDSIIPSDIVTYNSGFFEPDLINPHTVSLRHGALANVAFIDNSDTIEDGCVVTESLASKLSTPSSKRRNIILDVDTAVHDLVKVGDIVSPDSILCTLEDSLTIDIPEQDSNAVNALQQLAMSTPKAEAAGVVTKIELLYYSDISNLSESLATIAKADSKYRKQQAKLYNTSDAVTGEVKEVIMLNGRKVNLGQAAIIIYIDGEVPLGVADKLSFVNQLKATVSRVDTNGITTTDGTPVDALFSYTAVSARIVNSPEIIGIMCPILEALSKETARIYYED